jgi:hypothetical protein
MCQLTHGDAIIQTSIACALWPNHHNRQWLEPVTSTLTNAPNMNENADTITLGHLTVDLRNPTRSVEEALSEVDRELSVRVRCFGRWVADRKLAAIDAKDRLERLVAAYHFLRVLHDGATDPLASSPDDCRRPTVGISIPDELPALTAPGK